MTSLCAAWIDSDTCSSYWVPSLLALESTVAPLGTRSASMTLVGGCPGCSMPLSDDPAGTARRVEPLTTAGVLDGALVGVDGASPTMARMLKTMMSPSAMPT